MTVVDVMHDSIPRWQGWVAVGPVLLVVSLLGLGSTHVRRPGA